MILFVSSVEIKQPLLLPTFFLLCLTHAPPASPLEETKHIKTAAKTITTGVYSTHKHSDTATESHETRLRISHTLDGVLECLKSLFVLDFLPIQNIEINYNTMDETFPLRRSPAFQNSSSSLSSSNVSSSGHQQSLNRQRSSSVSDVRVNGTFFLTTGLSLSSFSKSLNE